MPIVYYVILVWLKIIICTSLIFLWLWVARDRGYTGGKLLLHTLGALALWAAPWIVFFIMQAELYQGRCGLRQGVRECGVLEFLWARVRWLRYGMLIDVALLLGVLFVIGRARISRGTNSGADITLAANLVGTGSVEFNPNLGGGQRTVTLSGNNAGFTGTIRLLGDDLDAFLAGRLRVAVFGSAATVTPVGGSRCEVVMRVTAAPRAAAAAATAWPMRPDERFPRKRTSSSGSRVPPALTSKRTPSQRKAFSSAASSASASVTALEPEVRSSPRKLQSLNHTTLPPPKKGSVWSASRSLPRALSASPLFPTAASMRSWSMPPTSAHRVERCTRP